MKAVKRLLCAALVACLLVAALVPAVLAADPLTYSFASASGNLEITYGGTYEQWNGYTDHDINEAFAINDNVWYINQSASNKGRSGTTMGYYPNHSWATIGAFTAPFCGAESASDIDAGQWIAFEVMNVPKGTYELSIETGNVSARGAKFDVYVLDKAKYNVVIGSYNLASDTVLTKEQNNAIYQAFAVNGAILNDLSKAKVDSSYAGTHNIGSVTFPNTGNDTDDYVFLFRIVEKVTGWTLCLTNLTMTPAAAPAEAMIGSTSYATVADAITAAGSGDTIVLQTDVATGDIELPEGVILDLNGKTVTATVRAENGILTDRSNGAGKIVKASVYFDEVGSNEVALVDGEYFRIFDYTLEAAQTNPVVKDGDAAYFWFDVRLSKDAYALIAKADNESKFKVGATMQWNNDEEQTVGFGTNLSVKDWAGKMLTEDYSFYVKVTGLSNAAEAGTLKVMPTVSGEVGGGKLADAMICSVEAAQ